LAQVKNNTATRISEFNYPEVGIFSFKQHKELPLHQSITAMLTDDEIAFMDYWERNRDKQNKIFKQLLLGIPVGLLFAIPIVFSLVSGWDKRAVMVANTGDFNPGILLVALLLIVGFTAIFSRKYRWDQNEQKYRELQAKKGREEE
jgi:hypothetical protein